jgi:radical SAM superfamily enzyme YgiQ (UPF0313 family)
MEAQIVSARVLLIWPNSRNEVLGWGDLGAVAEPLSLEYLGAALKSAGHDARILDLRLHPEAVVDAIEEYQPHLLGVTAFSMHVRRAIEICGLAKTLIPGVQTIVGGHHATFLAEDFFTPAIDYVVSGEGMDAIVAVADAAFRRGKCLPVPGLHIRTEAGKYETHGDASYRPDLETYRRFPIPDRTLTGPDRQRYFIDWMRPVALLRTSSGCPYRCTFCSIWRAMEGHYYLREVDSVVEELRQIDEENVFLVDDEAFINGKRMERLAAAIAAAGIKKNYFTYCRIDTLVRNQRAVTAWTQIGLRRLFVGIDAISSEDLTDYNKACSVAQIEDGLALARQLGIEIFAQFVVNTNYTQRDFKRLVRFIEHHALDYPSFTVLTPLPGTPLLGGFETVTERQENGRPNWDLFDCQNAVTGTQLSAVAFRQEYRKLYRVFKGSYTQYREHNCVVDEGSAEDALASGAPSAAVRLELTQASKGAVV